MGVGEIQVTWSPQPQTGRTVTASFDGNAPVEYKIEGKESMCNGGTVQSGHESVLLSNGKSRKLALANQSLTVRELFPGETVMFPFSELDQKAHTELRKCYGQHSGEALIARPSGLAGLRSGSGPQQHKELVLEKTQGDTSNEGREGTFLKWVDTAQQNCAAKPLQIRSCSYTLVHHGEQEVFHVKSLCVSGCIPG